MSGAAELERLVVRLVGEASQYNKTLNAAVQDTKKASKVIDQIVDQVMKGHNRVMEEAARITQAATTSTERYKQSLKDLEAHYKSGTISGETYRRSMDGLNKEFERGSYAAVAFGEKLKTTGTSIRNTGTMMTMGVTLPVAGMVAAWGKFDNAMTESTAIMSGVTEDMRKDMGALTREISGRSVTSATDLAKSYYYLASAGLSAEQSMFALATVERFAVAGAFDMEVATTLLADAQSALGLSSKDAAKNMRAMLLVSDMLVEAGNVSNASVQQFSEALTNDAGGAIKQYNMDLTEGVALLAAYADQGVKGQVAGSMMARGVKLTIQALNNHSKEFDKFGIKYRDFAATGKNFTGVLEGIAKALSGMGPAAKAAALEKLGFEALSQQAILPLLGATEKIRNYEKALKNAGGTTQDVADKQLKSFNNQAKILWNQVKNAADEIGEILAPTVAALGVVLGRLLKRWDKTSESTKHFIAVIAGLTAVIGPLLIVLGSLIMFTGGVIKSIGTLWPIVAKLALKLSGAAVTTEALTVAEGQAVIATDALAVAQSKAALGAAAVTKAFAIVAAQVALVVVGVERLIAIYKAWKDMSDAQKQAKDVMDQSEDQAMRMHEKQQKLAIIFKKGRPGGPIAEHPVAYGQYYQSVRYMETIGQPKNKKRKPSKERLMLERAFKEAGFVYENDGKLKRIDTKTADGEAALLEAMNARYDADMAALGGGSKKDKKLADFTNTFEFPSGMGIRQTSGYGKRKAPKRGASTNHLARDYGTPKGTDLKNIADAVVKDIIYSNKGYGNRVILEYADGLTQQLSHLNDIVLKESQVGTVIPAGTLLGHTGSTGTSTGNHLDRKFFINGKPVDVPEFAAAAKAAGVGINALSEADFLLAAAEDAEKQTKEQYELAVNFANKWKDFVVALGATREPERAARAQLYQLKHSGYLADIAAINERLIQEKAAAKTVSEIQLAVANRDKALEDLDKKEQADRYAKRGERVSGLLEKGHADQMRRRELEALQLAHAGMGDGFGFDQKEFEIRIQYEDARAKYATDLEMQEALHQQYLDNLAALYKEHYEWKKAQDDWYTQYTMGALREQLEGTRSTEEEKARIHEEMQRRIAKGEAAMSDSIKYGIEQGKASYVSWSEMMAKLSKDSVEGFRETFGESFVAGVRGDTEQLSDVWENYCRKMADDYIMALGKMMAQRLLFGEAAGPGEDKLGGGGGFMGWVSGLFGGGGGGASAAGDSAGGGDLLAALDRAASGGVYDHPVIAGEAGPEAIIPLSGGRAVPVDIRGRGAAGGGDTHIHNYNINAVDAPSFQQLLAEHGGGVITQYAMAVAPGAVAENADNGGIMSKYIPRR